MSSATLPDESRSDASSLGGGGLDRFGLHCPRARALVRRLARTQRKQKGPRRRRSRRFAVLAKSLSDDAAGVSIPRRLLRHPAYALRFSPSSSHLGKTRCPTFAAVDAPGPPGLDESAWPHPRGSARAWDRDGSRGGRGLDRMGSAQGLPQFSAQDQHFLVGRPRSPVCPPSAARGFPHLPRANPDGDYNRVGWVFREA